MSGGELCRPHLVVRARRVAVLPDVLDLQRAADRACPDLVPEQPFEKVLVERQGALREHRIAKLLEFLEDFVVQPGIVMVRPRQEHDANPVFAFELVQHVARAFAEVRLVRGQLTEAHLDGARILLRREAEDRLERPEQLLPEQLAIREVDQRIEIDDALLGEDVAFLGERRFHRVGRHRDRGTRIRSLQVDERRVELVDHREEDRIELLFRVFRKQQVVNVGDPDLRGKARIDGATAGALAIQIAAREIRIHEIPARYAQRFEVCAEERRIYVHVQHPGHADAERRAPLHQFHPPPRAPGPDTRRHRIRHPLRLPGVPDVLRGNLDEVRIGLLDGVEACLDAAHRVDVFDRPLFAGGDNQALLVGRLRHLRHELDWRGLRFDRHDVIAHLDVDERAQAVVLAEVASRRLVARGAIRDAPHRFQTDELRTVTVVPQSAGFHRRTNRAGLAAVFVHDDFRLDLRSAEIRPDEVHFGFHRRQVVLRPALQNEPRAELRQIRNTRDVQEDVLGENRRQTGQDFLWRPSLPLEVDDVRLHEDGAAVPEHRHRGGRERALREFLDRNPERLGGRLQEVAVARRALRVQLEVLDPPLRQDDEFDVLAADIDDDVGILVVLDRRLGMSHRLDECRVGRQHVLQNVFRVSGRAHAEHFERRPLRLDLFAQLVEDVDRVLDGIAFRELIGLAQHVAVGRQQHALGGGGPAIEADERRHLIAGGKCCRREPLGRVMTLEGLELFRRGAQTAPAGRRLLFQPTHIDVALER